jgi:CheY-like chemotaxis protein
MSRGSPKALLNASRSANGNPSCSAVTLGPVQASSSQLSILVVEDRPDVRLALRYMLEALDYSVREAGDGATALNQLTDHPCDVILSDWNMPGTARWELLSSLKARALKVIVLTGSADAAELERIRRSGVDAVLTKPASRDVLQRTIVQVLRNQSTGS